jgi:hypothetical protein
MTLSPLPRPGHSNKPQASSRTPSLEALEDRTVPSTISGFVYNDLNGNGIQDANEPGIAGAQVTLFNAQNQLLGTVTSGANGYYVFNTDPTIPTTPQTLTQEVDFSGTTDFTQNGSINQFDPSLGQLTSVQITYQAAIHTDMKAENLDAAAQTVTTSVNGDLKLQVGTVGALDVGVNVNQTKQLSAYDGVSDFAGTSGMDSGEKDSGDTKTLTLTAGQNDLSAFIGTGTVSLSNIATATSTASGSGNLLSTIQTTATGKATIVYTYTPATGLQPGNYTIHEQTPSGYQDGYETQGNVTKIPGTVGTDVLQVTLTGTANSTQNNFGEVQLSSLAGFVYHDHNDNGLREAGDEGLAGVVVRVVGTDFAGRPVDQVTQSAADGSYLFDNLAPGTYSIGQLTQPAGFLPGLSTAGNLGGAASQDQILNITTPGNAHGVEYNFGHFKPGTLSGFVYNDVNNNGFREPGEVGLAGSLIVLSGQAFDGTPVYLTMYSQADGSYQFTGLLPGVYSIIQLTQPVGYIDGKDAVGTQGGVLGTDRIDQAVVVSGTQGVENDFGEIQSVTPPPQTTPLPPSDIIVPPPDSGLPPTTVFSKRLFSRG